MTICIAALAEDGKAIVCAADKMLSFGDYLQWDSDVTKIIPIKNTKCISMIAGSVPQCAAVLDQLALKTDFGNDALHTADLLGEVYKVMFEKFQDTTVLHRSGLTRNLYHELVAAREMNRFAEKIANEMHDFESEQWDCNLTVCGFESGGTPFILSGSAPGNVLSHTAQGFHSIGIHPEIANARLLFSEYKREHPLGRVLFDVLDAKVNAEQSAGVGFEWDVHIVYPDAVVPVVTSIRRDLIEAGWDEHFRSPFEKYDPKWDLKPPRGWKDKIIKLSRQDLEAAIQAAKDEAS